ncbi:class I SAM-dependent methyltransferase [Jeotgalibacillus aurantiacus]|uniref:class I SAM-dependent methyltransferase n=1 Tax=Jeotgalibacillus aurantiacus TaxID=2763266 RepID=UPI001D0AF38E|nr:class I SAM-dependent methyltransferase [Jeotgalibacillus aurantiacus]
MNPWDRRFSAEKYIYGTEPNEFLVYAQKKCQLHSAKVLTVAEGEGRNAVFLARKENEVEAWDYSAEGLAKVQRLAEQNRVEVKTRLVDLTQAEWKSESADAVINIFGHIDPAGRTDMLDGIKSTVKPGGYFISEVYSKHQLAYKTGGPPDMDYLYAAMEMLEEFSDWKLIHFFTGEVERYEGKLHNGLSHVVQVIAQKV